jgi:DNA-binding response OmpR family regulator
VCEPSGIIRQGVRLALNNLGIRTIVEASTFLAAHKACGEGEFDFLVLNQELEANDATFILRELRTGVLGTDPFVMALLLLATRDEAKVRSAINSGSDDLLLIPFAPDQLMSRLKVLIDRRKPFIVTHDYMGPDRRSSTRPGATSATQFQAPNPIRARALGVPPERYDRQKADVFQSMVVERVKSLAASVEWEGNALMVSARDGSMTGESAFRSLYKLETMSEELISRIQKSFGHTTDTIDAFLKTCRQMKNQPSKASFSDVEALAMSGRKIAATYTAR